MSKFMTPKEVSLSLVETGKKKATEKAINLFVLGILAGLFIGFAAHLATVISTGSTEWYGMKKFMAGSVFSVGLILVIIGGSELWTGNNLMTIALFQKKITINNMLRNWGLVYLGNLVGSLILAFFIAKSSGLLDGAIGGTAIKIAMGKVAGQVQDLDHNYAYFFRAIGCNLLVCLAVILALSAKDTAGKILAIYFPIMAFVASGFEHCIANMYFIPAGIFAMDFDAAILASGIGTEALSSLNWISMWTQNILVVTLGNFVGGALMVGVTYWFLYVKNHDKVESVDSDSKNEKVQVRRLAKFPTSSNN